MALDRFVIWQKYKPTKGQLGKVLKNYVGSAGNVKCQKNRWFCVLVGSQTNPLMEIPGFPKEAYSPPRKEKRWFEVYWQEHQQGIVEPSIDVITRQQDVFTNAVALGFQELCLVAWQGKR